MLVLAFMVSSATETRLLFDPSCLSTQKIQYHPQPAVYDFLFLCWVFRVATSSRLVTSHFIALPANRRVTTLHFVFDQG